jgi:predicted metal-dependent phosphotriesterase family hydrolase
MTKYSRREIVGCAGALCLALGDSEAKLFQTRAAYVQTVTGPIPAGDLGFTLPHEHVMCDFIGADKTGPHRWKQDEVIAKALPFLREINSRGVKTLFDCTPAYIGRDPIVLKRLAQETGLNIVTNTGYYGAANDKYLPKLAFDETAEQLAARWVKEWEKGIDETGVRPGFIKIGVDPATGDRPRLSAVDEKLVRAAATASQRTGLTVASHTGQGAAALEEVRIFREEGAKLEKLIIVHADSEPDPTMHEKMAGSGAWVEYDGVGSRPIEQHVKLVKVMLERRPDRLLLSMDAGWYNVGEPDSGKFRPYTDLTNKLLPALKQVGISQQVIDQVTIENPAKAFGRQ